MMNHGNNLFFPGTSSLLGSENELNVDNLLTSDLNFDQKLALLELKQRHRLQNEKAALDAYKTMADVHLKKQKTANFGVLRSMMYAPPPPPPHETSTHQAMGSGSKRGQL